VADRTQTQPETTPERTAMPDWAPWAVLGALSVFGLAGGLLLRSSGHAKTEAAGTASAAAAPAPTAAAAPSANDGSIGAVHLVVTFKDTAMGTHQHVTRTKEEARQRAGEALARARKGEDFSALVREYSDEPSSDQWQKGVLASFRKAEALPGFGDAAFALKVGEVSDLVETGLGFHVIKRTR
jgi:NIMA-interacting peptidyl-prolyl cis-trans isomerase 1